jgi:DNA-binding transcriptional LysR family regulator
MPRVAKVEYQTVEIVAIRSRNLNLIPILRALLKEVSVAKAAAQIGLSQPAMSAALARLRDQFKDPLLVRAGRQMRLTPRALRMRRQLEQICVHIESFFQPESFDPATATDNFVIAAPDYLALLLSGALINRLAAEAPRVRVKFVDVPIDLPAWMDESHIDLAVCGDFGLWPQLSREHLFWNRMVAAVAADHPVLKHLPVTSKDLMRYPSLHYDVSTVHSTRETQIITGIPSLDWRSQISTSQFSDAVLLAVKSPIVARAPASLVDQLAERLSLVRIELVGEETKINESMFWAPIHDNALEHLWLRNLIRECLAPFSDKGAVGKK